MTNNTEEKLKKLQDSLFDAKTDIDNQIDELYFLSMAIPAMFSDGMPSDRYISGMHFSMNNLANRMEKINNELVEIRNIAATGNNTQGAKQ